MNPKFRKLGSPSTGRDLLNTWHDGRCWVDRQMDRRELVWGRGEGIPEIYLTWQGRGS